MQEIYKIENEIWRLNDLKDNIIFTVESLEQKLSKIRDVEPPKEEAEDSVEKCTKQEGGDYKKLESRIYDFISEKTDIVEVDLKYGDKIPYRE